MNTASARWALLYGNFTIGCGVMVTAGALNDLVSSLQVSVAVGGFGDPAFPPPDVSVYDSRRHSWVRLPEGVEAYDKDPA